MRTFTSILNRKIYFLTLIAVLFHLSTEVTAQTVQSDYEIQQTFKNKYKAFSDSLEAAQSTKEVKRLTERIRALEENYKDYATLLDKVLYPDTFEGEMKSLKRRLITTNERLATIEHQEERLDILSEQLSSYDVRLEQLSSETDSLQAAIEQSTRSEKELSGLVRQYRESLERRDDLILSLVDSVMIAYNNMDLKSIRNFEEARIQSKISPDGNALKMIEGIARENIRFLDSNSRASAEDYLRMNAVQQQFEEMWKTLGNDLAEIYAEENAAEAKTQVDKAIKEWNDKVTESTWSSISRAIKQEGFDIPPFSNSKEFFDSLNGYIDNSISASSKKATEEGHNNYLRFKSFWTNQVKVKWSDYLNKGDLLTNKQIAAVDQKLDEWAIKAEPKQSNLLVYLLGASVLAIVVLGGMLAKEKTNSHSHS